MSDNTIKKPEKLASAVYLITSFFADEEPMKWKLRTLASDLVSVSITLKDSFSAEESVSLLEVRKIISKLRSLLLVSKNAGLLSDVNYEIITKELLNHKNVLSLPTGMSEENGSTVISFESLESVKELPSRTVQEDQINIKDKNENTPEKSNKVEDSSKTLQEGEKTKINENILASTGQKSKKPRKHKEFGAVSVKKTNRKNIIISLLKRKKDIMIKDVTPLITDCSEKTIQRELSSMVDEGILKKEGEKRWSKYSLA